MFIEFTELELIGQIGTDASVEPAAASYKLPVKLTQSCDRPYGCIISAYYSCSIMRAEIDPPFPTSTAVVWDRVYGPQHFICIDRYM
jgi:hypothetical protein